MLILLSSQLSYIVYKSAHSVMRGVKARAAQLVMCQTQACADVLWTVDGDQQLRSCLAQRIPGTGKGTRVSVFFHFWAFYLHLYIFAAGVPLATIFL